MEIKQVLFDNYIFSSEMDFQKCFEILGERAKVASAVPPPPTPPEVDQIPAVNEEELRAKSTLELIKMFNEIQTDRIQVYIIMFITFIKIFLPLSYGKNLDLQVL
jgi:hypothetical protein